MSAEGDDSFLNEIIGIFLDDTPKRLDELRSAFAARDQQTFTRAAHSIKGSSSNIGAMRLRVLAEQLEHASRQSSLPGLDAQIPAIEAEFNAVRTELEKLQQRQGQG